MMEIANIVVLVVCVLLIIWNIRLEYKIKETRTVIVRIFKCFMFSTIASTPLKDIITKFERKTKKDYKEDNKEESKGDKEK